MVDYPKFSDFATDEGKLDGEKVKLKDILNQDILVLAYFATIRDFGKYMHSLKYIPRITSHWFICVSVLLAGCIDFLGYRHYRDHTLLIKSSARNLKARIKDAMHMEPEAAICSIMSSLGWLCHCDSFHLASRYILDNKDATKMLASHSEHLGIENPLQNYMRKHHAVL